MSKNPIVHFEIPADDVARAQEFYAKTFGWEFNKFDMPSGEPYYGVLAADVGENKIPKNPGEINGGLMKRKDPNQPFMNYISVASIDTVLPEITTNGGTIVMPKTEIAPGMGWIAAFKDTERNIIGLHEWAQKTDQ